MNITESNAAVRVIKSLHKQGHALSPNEAEDIRVLLIQAGKALNMSWPDLQAWLTKATS